MPVSSRDSLRLVEAGRQVRKGLITEARGCCSVSSGMACGHGQKALAEQGVVVGRAAGLCVPTSPRGPQPGPFPLLAAELNQERQHRDLRRLEALQKHEVSPGE